jgi:hypothetical protein
VGLKIEEVANGNIKYDWKTQRKAQKRTNLFNLLCYCRDEWKWKRKKEMKKGEGKREQRAESKTKLKKSLGR